MKLNNMKKSAQRTKKESPERDYIAIVSNSSLCGVWTGSEEDSIYDYFEDTRTGFLCCLEAVLENIPTNEELLNRQVAIYLPDMILKVHTAPGDMIRDDSFDLEQVNRVCTMIAERSYNIVFAREKGSKAKVVSDAYDWIKSISKANNKAAATGSSSAKASKAVVADDAQCDKIKAKIDDINNKMLDALANDDDDLYIELESKLSKLEDMLRRRREMIGATAPVVEESKADIEDSVDENGDIDLTSVEL